MYRHMGRWLLAAGVLSLALALQHPAKPATAQQLAPSDRAAVLTSLLSAVNNGDVDGATSVFTDNAVFIGALRNGNCSQSAPCTDVAGIHQQLTSVVAAHTCFVLRSITVSGAIVTGQLDTRNDAIRNDGVDHIRQDFTALIPGNQITFWLNLTDSADPQTALDLAIRSGAQQAGTPLPNPMPCGAVS